MSEFKSASFSAEDGSNGTDFVGVTTFTSPYYFVPPSGTTAQRPSGEGLTPGMLRFNTDIGRLEVWRGDHWGIILGDSPDLSGGARGVFALGYLAPGGNLNKLEYVTISTLGNSTSFGTLLSSTRQRTGCSSSTRGLIAGGYTGPAYINTIEYITISSTGNSISFGQLSTATRAAIPLSSASSTRGLFAGGYVAPVNTNVIDYVTIASTGNAVNFGSLSS